MGADNVDGDCASGVDNSGGSGADGDSRDGGLGGLTGLLEESGKDGCELGAGAMPAKYSNQFIGSSVEK